VSITEPEGELSTRVGTDGESLHTHLKAHGGTEWEQMSRWARKPSAFRADVVEQIVVGGEDAGLCR